MSKCRGNFWDLPISSGIMEQNDLSIIFWENAPKEDKKEMLKMLKEKSLKEEMVEDEAVIIKKGTRKPTTRGTRRKQKFAHKSEREKKQIRKYSGDRLLDRHSGWVDWDATIQERKRQEATRDALRDGDYMAPIREEEEYKDFLEEEVYRVSANINILKQKIKDLQGEISYLEAYLASIM